jgi:6-pyruvoyl-tetrahydropterin synthase
VDLEIKGEVNPATGMLVDFKELKALVDSILPDHRCLNDVLPDIVPTAENLAQYFFARFDLAFVLRKWGVEVVSVAVWESDDACAIYP